MNNWFLAVENGSLLPGTYYLFRMNSILVAFSVIFLILFGLYASLCYPLLAKTYRFKSVTQTPHKSSMIISASISILAMATILYFCDKSSALAFAQSYWTICDYWILNPKMRPPTGLTYYCYGFIVLNLIVAVVFFMLIRSKKVTPEDWDKLKGDPEKNYNIERHAFLVAAHNSADGIKPCLDAILKLVKPHQIYICDNGSSKLEEAKIRKFCKLVSDDYCTDHGLEPGSSQIQVAHLSNYGSKALAQYACLYHLGKKLEDGSGVIDIVTMIDDDVCVSPEWNYKEVDRLLDNPSTVAVAYGIRASNANLNVCTAFQDLEYICGNVARYIQDLLGSQLFASGAIATWKVPIALELLLRHPTHFNGEDLEFGVILAKLSDSKTDKLGIDGVVRMAFYKDCVIGTDVPPHVWHYYDFLPRPVYRYFKIKNCECGEHSLYNQRFRSWEVATHAYITKLFKVVISPRGWTSKSKNAVRLICFWRLLDQFLLYFSLVGLGLMLVGFQPARGIANIACLLITSWALTIIALLLFSTSVSPIECGLSPDLVMTFPLLFSLPMLMLMRFVCIPYYFCYYLWYCRFPAELRIQLKEKKGMKEVLHTCWENKIVDDEEVHTVDVCINEGQAINRESSTCSSVTCIQGIKIVNLGESIPITMCESPVSIIEPSPKIVVVIPQSDCEIPQPWVKELNYEALYPRMEQRDINRKEFAKSPLNQRISVELGDKNDRDVNDFEGK